MRRKTVAKRVDPAGFGDTSALFGSLIGFLQAGGIQRAERFTARRKQPAAGPSHAPVCAEGLEQARRQDGVAILATLALHHANRHALGIDVVHLQVEDFGQTQPRRIRR